jgi:alpha-D-ribose 1-methylphosphonate 5-triphosphate synthase subunit PhnL
MAIVIEAVALQKSFVLHNQGGAVLPVFSGAGLTVEAGETVVLTGPSGAGKSSLLRILYGNYKPDGGYVRVRHRGRMMDIVAAPPRVILDVRRHTLSFVSQFLRVIPRVPALEIVKSPMLARGIPDGEADRRARTILARLNLPERLWGLAPATFSGGEQQRVNIARSFAAPTPIILLDEPTASLDAANCGTAVELIRETAANGTAIVGIFHDEAVRACIATRLVDIPSLKQAA